MYGNVYQLKGYGLLAATWTAMNHDSLQNFLYAA